MSHFVKDDKFNIFRLPVGWQYLVSSPGGTLNSANLQKYDQLVQACLKTSSNTVCVIDIHNYARWNKQIIGQGGPTNAQFVSLWTQLATKYKSESKIAFGVMNEPHEVDITKWADTVQQVVTAIRGAGATTQMSMSNFSLPHSFPYPFHRSSLSPPFYLINHRSNLPPVFLPGNDYTSAGRFISNGSGAALLPIKNPDGTNTNLIFDVHKYLDSDNSGTHTECVTDNVDSAFQPLATWLRSNGRQAILTETGGGNTSSCSKYM